MNEENDDVERLEGLMYSALESPFAIVASMFGNKGEIIGFFKSFEEANSHLIEKTAGRLFGLSDETYIEMREKEFGFTLDFEQAFVIDLREWRQYNAPKPNGRKSTLVKN